MMFIVRVPVLSDASSVTAPNVSIPCKFLTSTLCFDSALDAYDSSIVICCLQQTIRHAQQAIGKQ
jgi:hypothetical protein